ncbi:amino acid transporter [Athelia psychrophila]|uniref:Amino acid transporter n=1 Tax=Athelia psychrophila TaxID=1759441 RepID=A0A166MAD3_9AGAM|nr:amino acid transporter [Fibularhizoctonia sp. CBS 109695]
MSATEAPEAPDEAPTRKAAASGAPIERVCISISGARSAIASKTRSRQINPLGYEVTLLSGVMLNLGQLMGAGIYSVPGSILNSVGSIGLLLAFWLLGSVFAFAGLSLYSEFASMFPNRSGGEVVYLEMSYPRPRFLVPTMFAITAVLLSFSATNSIIFAQYFLTILDIPVTSHRQTVTALAVCTVAIAVVGLSTKWSLRAVNILTALKLASASFMVVAGVAVLAGVTRVQDPYANFHNIWAGSTTNLNSLATAFVKINYSFVGWHNAFNLLGEVRGGDPARTVRRSGAIALWIATALFFLINVAYVAAVPREEIRRSGQLIAVLFFRHVFGDSWGAKVLPAMVALSCFGNLTAGQARVIREVARQGLLPYPAFFASTKPFGTPLAPVVIKYVLTVLVIVAVPGKDAFNFLLDLASYPNLVFNAALAVGLWLVRKRRALEGDSPSGYKAKNVYVFLFLLSAILLLVMPWVPPEPGHGDVSFWHATCSLTLFLMQLCALYYYVWIKWLPRLGGYTVVEEVKELDDGARTTRLTRRYHKGGEEEPLLADASSRQ